MTIKNYIMLIGDPSDVVLQYFAAYLTGQHSNIIYIDQNLLGSIIHLDSNYWYLPELGKVSHADIAGVYNRCMGFAPTAKLKASIVNANAFLSSLLDYEYPLVVNKPSAMLSNNSKPMQSHMLCNMGLEMPEYVCIANTVIVHHSNNIIYKSICSVRSIVNKLQISSHAFVKEPVLLQQVIYGYNIRVHVVGSNIFATKITAKQIDYRYCDHSKHEPYNLPAKIKCICHKIANKLNLLFCGIDLIFMQGKYYLLEVNTAPGYNYYERSLPAHSISAALYNLLRGEKNDFAA